MGRNKKVSKQHRFSSFLSLVLCISLIAGTVVNAFAEAGGGDEGQNEASLATEQRAIEVNAEQNTSALLRGDLRGEAIYTVIFQDYDGTELAKYQVEAGKTSPVPAPPSRQDYAFVGWNTSLIDVQRDLVVKAEYRELKKYAITIYYQFADGSMAAQPYIAEVKEGYSLAEEIVSPQVVGYVPNQSSIMLNISSAQSDGVFTVVYTKQSGTAYVVRHHLEALASGGYELASTDTLYGDTAQNVVASPKNYPGFELIMPLASGTIAADGSLELNLYYKRKEITLNFESNGGIYIEPISGKYGEAVVPPADPKRPGHSFDGWDPATPSVFPAENMNFVAKWTRDTEADYIVLYWVENANDDGYSMVGSEIKNGTVGTAPELPDPTAPFPENILFPNTNSRDKKEFFYDYNEAKTVGENNGLVINAEKSTFVNAYFDRKELTVHFTYVGHPTWFHPDNVLYPGKFSPLARKYQVEMGGTTRISEDYGTSYDFSSGQDTLTPEAERTISVTAKYMADISEDVPRIRYMGAAGVDPDQPAMIATFYSTNRWSWSHHMTTSDPVTHQPTVMTAYYFVSSYGTYRGTEGSVNFYLTNTDLTPSYQYTPMFEPVGGGQPDRSDYGAGEPITVTFFRYSSDKSMMSRRFVGFKNPDPDRVFNPWYGGIENQEYQWPEDAKVYYERERYILGFYDGTTALKEYTGDEALWYGEQLAAYYYEPTAPADKPDYTFAGWYTDKILQDETTLLDFDRAIMPPQGLVLYAKWTAPTYQITFDLNGVAGDVPATQDIDLGGYINPPSEPTRNGYTFGGWTERNRTVAHNMSYPVNRHLDLVAQWIPNNSGRYTVYYLEIGSGNELCPPKTFDNLAVGSSHTQTAELIDGYLPDTISRSISINANARFNSLVFYYKAFTSVNYTVRYEDLDGRELASAETKTTRNNYVTENFKAISGCYPLENQITLPLTLNAAQNIMVFKYLSSGTALYTVRHFQQNLDGVSYSLVATEQASGQAGQVVQAAPRSYNGFAHHTGKSILIGTVSSDGSLVLDQYYDRHNLTVSFVAAEGGSLYGTSSYSGILWGTSFRDAVRVPTPRAHEGYAFSGWSPSIPFGGSAVTSSIVYTALFERTQVPPIVTVDQPSITRTPSDTTTPFTRKSPSSNSPQKTLPDTEAIQDNTIPLVGGDGHWALLNLILALAGVVVGLIVAIKRFVDRKQGENKENQSPDQQNLQREEEQSEKQGKSRLLGTMTLLTGLVSLMVFFLTENMTLPMSFMDQWTMLMVILAIIETLFIVVPLGKKLQNDGSLETA